MKEDGFEVAHLCDVLKVHRNGYYTWLNSSENVYQQQDQKLAPMIQDIFYQHRRRYGARRIAIELQGRGERCSRAKVRKIMGQMGLVAIQPKSFKPRTTESRHKLGYSPNLLLAGVEVNRVDQVWVGDITYIPLPSSFAYLAMLMDLYSRKIVGWALELNMQESLVIAALNYAIKTRRWKIWGKSGDRHKRDFPEQHSVGFSRLPWPSVRRSGHVNASEVQPSIESQARQLVISLPRCKGNRTDRIIG